jgi:hypothetical protein
LLGSFVTSWADNAAFLKRTLYQELYQERIGNVLEVTQLSTAWSCLRHNTQWRKQIVRAEEFTMLTSYDFNFIQGQI